MLDTDELLTRLDAKGVRNVDIARTLGLPDSRVPEIKRKERALKLDEAAKLVQAFELESNPPATPLPPSVLRLAILYVGEQLGVSLHEQPQRVEELVKDIRAFSALVADPRIRGSAEAVEGFFHALRSRHSATEEEALPGTDPDRIG